MIPSTLSVFELFEKERRYVVPLFQRPYVWTEEKQWRPLWEDIAAKADELLYAEADGTAVGTHFLGAAVLKEIKTFGRQVAAREIIDGQQRLTTLQIILTAFRDIVAGKGSDESTVKILNRLTLNDCRMEDPFEQHKVWPTTADRRTFETVVQSGSPDRLSEHFPLIRIPRTQRYYERPRLAEAYHFFSQAIHEYLDGVDDNDMQDDRQRLQRLDSLIDAITKYMQIVVIELEDRDDPQIIFETLNARGEPLLPSDLIRNFVFLEAARRREDVENLYRTYWQHFDEYESGDASFWKEDERQGRFFRPRIDLFMFHFLVFQTGRDFLITHLFQEFRRWWDSLPGSLTVEQRLRIVLSYSRTYKRFFEKADKPSRLSLFVYRLSSLDTSTVYPVLLYLFGEDTLIAPSERDAIIADIESYLVRRIICRLSSKNYNRIFLTLLRNLRRTEQIDRSTVRDLLLELKGENVRWPDDGEFSKAWMTHPLYEWLTKPRVRIILEAIDLQLETGKQELLHIEGNLSIEHIYPQMPQSGAWPPLTAETLKHTLGNLTLLTQALNSSVSNGPFSQKRPEIARQSRLRLNTYLQDYKNDDVWSAADIVNRGAKLFEIAQTVWPFPLASDAQGKPIAQAIAAEITSTDAYNDDPIASEEQPVDSDESIRQDVYELLKQTAREEGTITYTSVAYVLGLNMQSQLDRNELGKVLGSISVHEHRHGRPLLSAVTVFTNDGFPSNGFFNLAKDLGKFTGSTEMDKLTFFAKELKATHAYWKNQN